SSTIAGKRWKNHLREMDELRTSVQNAVFEQKDPLLVYKFESFELFQQMLKDVNQSVLSLLYKADLHVEENQQRNIDNQKRDDFSKLKTRHDDVTREQNRQREAERRVMAAASGGQQESQRPLSRAERRAQERKKKKRR
ncbi:MAG: hypothetical protein AAFQ87_02535, partial [Bacteroidota bacterium]